MNTATVEANTQELNELAQFEQALMKDLEDTADRGLLPEHRDAAAAETPPALATPVTAPAAVAPAPVPQTINPPAPTAAPITAEQDARDNAMRAARHAERVARRAEGAANARADAAEAALAEARNAKGPQTDEDADALARVEAEYPDVARVVKKALANVNPPPAAVAPEPEFIQHTDLPDTAQHAVDEVPELLEWLTTKGSADRWEAAQKQQAAIATEPAWKDKTLHDQLLETVRRVNTAFGTNTPDPRAAAAAVIDKTLSRVPETLSGLRGGNSPTHQEPDFRNAKTDDEVVAMLNAQFQ